MSAGEGAPTVRIAVVGLYNSGTSCVAGILHRLGVDMGAPFWENEANNYYEPYDLGCVLRTSWREPHGVAATTERVRIDILRHWVLGREATGNRTVGAKHPLLAMAPREVLAAWGEDTRFVWCQRDVEQSIRALQARGWFGPLAEPLQRRLARSLRGFFRDTRVRCQAVDFEHLRRHGEAGVRQLAHALELDSDETRIAAASASVIAPPVPRAGG